VVIKGANGTAVTVKGTLLLATPPTITTTFPVAAPVGTGTAMLVALQLVGVAAVPLKVTVLLPALAPKFVPVIVMGVPNAPELGLRRVTLGASGEAPAAALKAANPAPQLSDAASNAPAEASPAVACI
jgi:hypothetical protein